MTGDPRMFTSLDEDVDNQEKITFGDNSKGKVKGLGKIAISNCNSITNVLYVSSLASTCFRLDNFVILASNAYSTRKK